MSGKRTIKRSRAALQADPNHLDTVAARDDDTILRDIEADPIAAPVADVETWRGAELIEAESTVPVTLRIHRDTLRAFQKGGPDAERRMARVLDAHARQGSA